MVWSLRHYRTSDSASSDFTIYAFAPNTNTDRDKWKPRRFGMFSPQPARAVRRFLEFMVEHGDGYADDMVTELALDACRDEHGKVA